MRSHLGIPPKNFPFRLLCRAAIFLAVFLTGVAGAQPVSLEIMASGTGEMAYAVENLSGGLYLSVSRTNELLRRIDPMAEIRWDAVTGLYRAQVQDKEFSLFRDRAVVVYNQALIDTDRPLLAARGQVFVPLSSLAEMLKRLEGVESNTAALLGPERPGPVETPPVSLLPQIDTTAPGVNMGSLVETFRLISGGENLSEDEVRQDFRLGARPLLARKVVVLDPEIVRASAESEAALPRPGDSREEGVDLTLRIAERCRALLVDNPSISVVLTRDSLGASPSQPERLAVINGSGAKALISLRYDWSDFSENSGYRLFTVHEAVDPEGRRYHGRHEEPWRLPLEVQYVPYENLSLALAEFVDAELSRAGFPAAAEKRRLAPFYLLRRASMPSVSVALGYTSHGEDRRRMEEDRYVEFVAQSLAQALLLFDRWLNQVWLEGLQ
ncbi:N-acetylmuramoyl-L-alanine amidase [bacterium]|nr:N-acetylmuramoyl-L-alanine amidase [bacterium]